MNTRKSAGGIVFNNEGKLLLVSQRGDSWSLPKGHVNEGETVLEAAVREIREESGIEELQYIKELGSYERYRIGPGGVGEDRSELKSITVFLFRTGQIDLCPLDPDNPEARWVTMGEALQLLTHPKDREFLENNMQMIIESVSKESP